MIKCVASFLLVLTLLAHAAAPRAQIERGDGLRQPVAPTARILEIKGNQITIADSKGRRQTLELASTKGLKPGQSTGWCEEDCREIPVGSAMYSVKRRMPAR
jgi:hypothetical protein